MDRVRIGIIGAKPTGIAGRRLQHVCNHERAELMAVSCRTDETRAALAEEHGVCAVRDYRALLAMPTVDAVIVSTPNHTHVDMTRAALEAGKHACVEYPLCDSVTDHDALVSLAQRHGVVLHHGMNVRHEFLYGVLQEHGEAMGKPLLLHVTCFSGGGWYAHAAQRGNLFTAMHIHFIEYARGLLGDPAWVQASENDPVPDGLAFGSVTLGWPQGTLATIDFGTSTTCRPPWRFEFVGTEGHILSDLRSAEVVKGQAREHTTLESGGHDALAPDTDAFIQEVLAGGPRTGSLAGSRRLIHICEQCLTSARTGERISLWE